MNTLLRYLVITLFVVLLGSWFISMYKSCAAKDTTLTEQFDEDSLDDALSELDDGDLREGDADYNEEMDALDAEIAALEAELGELENDDAKPSASNAVTTAKRKPVTSKPVSNPLPRKNLSPSGPQYMVITGSYSTKANAGAMESKLENMGHSDVEVVQFDLSNYFSVCAGRFNNADNAKRLVDKLEDAGVQAYVHKRRQ